MFLHLENIGKISHANIEINGITVIAGENDTGKSTIGKALYSVFNSFYHFETNIRKTRFSLLEDAIETSLREYTNSLWGVNAASIVKTLFSPDTTSTLDDIRTLLLAHMYPMLPLLSNPSEVTLTDEYVASVIDLYKKYSCVPDEVVYLNALNRRIQNDFHSQINNIFSATDEGRIILTIKNKEVAISISGNRAFSVSNTLSLTTDAVYLDDPFVLDHLNSRNFNRRVRLGSDSFKQHLANKLTYGKGTSEVERAFKEAIVNEQLSEILKKLNSVCEGSLILSTKGFIYSPAGDGLGVCIGNVSLGLKTFIIIKTLLTNGSLEPNGTLILDEPEIHLHPKWQLVLAELLVLLQKEFGLHILLTTHSPYFLEAIEVYSKKHDISAKCKFYLAGASGQMSNLLDVTGDTEPIYKKLAAPFQTLENERYADD